MQMSVYTNAYDSNLYSLLFGKHEILKILHAFQNFKIVYQWSMYIFKYQNYASGFIWITGKHLINEFIKISDEA